jgi:hypothetical protein
MPYTVKRKRGNGSNELTNKECENLFALLLLRRAGFGYMYFDKRRKEWAISDAGTPSCGTRSSNRGQEPLLLARSTYPFSNFRSGEEHHTPLKIPSLLQHSSGTFKLGAWSDQEEAAKTRRADSLLCFALLCCRDFSALLCACS